MKMSRERARRAAHQRKAEDDLSSLTSFWTNTVLTGFNLATLNVAIDLVSTDIATGWFHVSTHHMATGSSYEPFPPQTGNESGSRREPSGYGGEGCRPPSEGKFGGSHSTTPSTSPLSSTPYSGIVATHVT